MMAYWRGALWACVAMIAVRAPNAQAAAAAAAAGISVLVSDASNKLTAPPRSSFAYAIATYAGVNRHQRGGDPVPPKDILKLHLRHLITVPMALQPSVLIVRPPLPAGQAELEGFYDVGPEIAQLEARGVPVTWIIPATNSDVDGGLGASFLAASEATLGLFDYYLWIKDDYAAASPHFDLEMIRLYHQRFGAGVGALAALLMGTEHELLSKTSSKEYPQSGIFLSSATVRRLLAAEIDGPLLALRRHADSIKSLDPLFFMFGGGHASLLDQQALGMLISDRGIPQATWSDEYRSPYWSGDTAGTLLDFGVKSDLHQHRLPLNHVLVVPLQFVHGSAIKVCCGPLGITGCDLDASCTAQLSGLRSCCGSWDDVHATHRNLTEEEAQLEAQLETAGLLPSTSLGGARTMDLFMHWMPPPFANNHLAHRRLALPMDLAFVPSFSMLRKHLSEQMLDLCRFYLPSRFYATTWKPEACAFDLVEQATRKVRALLAPLLREHDTYPLTMDKKGSLQVTARLDITLPCTGPSGNSLLFPQEVGIFLRGAVDDFLVQVPLHGHNWDSFGFVEYAAPSSKMIYEALTPQFSGLCSQTKLRPGWQVGDCANDLLNQVDMHLRVLCAPESSSREQTRFLGIGGNGAIPMALRYAWLRSASSPFDFTFSSAHSALALLSGRVANITGDVRPAVASDLNEHWTWFWGRLDEVGTSFVGKPFSPAMQMLFANDAICEWGDGAKCTPIGSFHRKYERRQKRLQDWIEDGSVDLELVFSHGSSSPLKHVSNSTHDASLDIAMLRSLLKHRPHVRVRTVEEALPNLRERCEANFEAQRRLSQRVSRSLASAAEPTHRFHAVTFPSNAQALGTSCGWMQARTPRPPEGELEDWYDVLVVSKERAALETLSGMNVNHNNVAVSAGGSAAAVVQKTTSVVVPTRVAASSVSSSVGAGHSGAVPEAASLAATASKAAGTPGVASGASFEGTVYLLPNNWLSKLPIGEFRNRPITYLEIGTFFGANLLSVAASYGAHAGSVMHCIDPWEDYQEYPEYKGQQASTYEAFLRNVAASGHQSRVVVHRGYSSDLIPSFKDASFDIIYVDGNHQPEYALEDAVLSFRKLKVGGFMIFDDYGWGKDDSTKGVDAFLSAYKDRIHLLGAVATQVFVRRLS